MSSAFTKHYARMMDTGMDLKADLERLSERVRLGQEQDHNESNTVGNLVLPLIAALGYDTQDIAEVEREYSVAGGSVDIIVKINDATAMIFECKRVSTDLDDANVGRLHGYFGKIPEASIGILTNGAEYQFFGNRSSTSNEMSMQPFLEIDLGDGVDDEEVDILRCFSRAMFEPARAMEDAGYSRNIVSYLRRQMFDEPMYREFISLLAKQSGSNRQRWTDQDRQDFEPRIKRALRKFADELVADQMESHSDTSEEMAGQEIIRHILRGMAGAAEVHRNSGKQYCTIQLDQSRKSRKRLCRLYFKNSSALQIQLADDEDQLVPVNAIYDILRYEDRIRKIAATHLNSS